MGVDIIRTRRGKKGPYRGNDPHYIIRSTKKKSILSRPRLFPAGGHGSSAVRTERGGFQNRPAAREREDSPVAAIFRTHVRCYSGNPRELPPKRMLIEKFLRHRPSTLSSTVLIRLRVSLSTALQLKSYKLVLRPKQMKQVSTVKRIGDHPQSSEHTQARAMSGEPFGFM